MNCAAQWGALSVLCLFNIQQGHAQSNTCGGYYACLTDGPTLAAAPSDQSYPAARPAGDVASIRCPEAAVDVTAASSDERQLVCSSAYSAIQLLGRCKITVQRPVQVHILSEVRHPFNGLIFGLFDKKHERVLVTRPENVPSLITGAPYEAIPQADFYRSLIVHEVIHGVMHQSMKRPADTHAAYEYPAYALQIESLLPAVREKFLRAFDQAARSDFMFSDSLLFFDPYFFAARAYEHYKASPDGCGHLRELLKGDVPFIAPPRI